MQDFAFFWLFVCVHISDVMVNTLGLQVQKSPLPEALLQSEAPIVCYIELINSDILSSLVSLALVLMSFYLEHFYVF